MKKIILAVTALVAVTLTSCNKEEVNDCSATPQEGANIEIRLASDAATRAFFDESVAPESWESSLHNMSMYVFDSSGDLIIRRELSESELTEKKVTFSLPNSTAGQVCNFYALANMSAENVTTVSAIENLIESTSLNEYNGVFSDVTSSAIRNNGFVMTGKTSATISDNGSTTSVSLTLKRLVAKVAVLTTLSDNFINFYNGGTVVITEAILSNVSSSSNLIHKENSYASRSSLYSHTQTPGSANGFANLFYVYENDALPQDENLLLTLRGYFDRDGDTATTGDQSEVEYTVSLDGSGAGKIIRNGYYRLELKISGLSGSDVVMFITVADWETPVTQSVEIGL